MKKVWLVLALTFTFASAEMQQIIICGDDGCETVEIYTED